MKHASGFTKIAYTLIAIISCGYIDAIHLDKLEMDYVTIQNNTHENQTLLITLELSGAPSIETQVLPLEIMAEQRLTINPKKMLSKSLKPKLISITEATQSTLLNLKRVSKEPYTLTIEKHPFPSLEASLFSFVPTIRDFKEGLNADAKRWEDVLAGRWNYTKATAPKSTKSFISFVTNLYNKNKNALLTPHAQEKIPKIIHHIWFGSKLPSRFHAWYETWIQKHPNWEHILWTDQSCEHNPQFKAKYPTYKEIHIRELGQLQNQKLFDEAKNYGEKSDIIRYEILKKFGGMYCDTDFECFEPFDILHHSYDFYAGMLPLDTGLLTVNNGFIGSRPNHPILQKCMDLMKSSKSINRYHYFAIICATGPVPMTKAVWQGADQDDNVDIIFPCSYFYPLAYRKTRIQKNIDIHPESMTVHYFTKTWARASAHQK